MEYLIPQFTFLSDQSLNNNNFDPFTTEDLRKLFEIESYKAWATMELEHETQLEEAESAMADAEEYLNSATEEFRRFEEEMERESREQLRGLLQVAEKARRMGNSMKKAASFASKKYIEATLNSAGASMKSAVKAVTSNSKKFFWRIRSSFYVSPLLGVADGD